jgi:Zn-finger nucleic acid-binding protein
MSTQALCPHCSRTFATEPVCGKKIVVCPHCQGWVLSSHVNAAPLSDSDSRLEASHSLVKHVCPHCKATVSLKTQSDERIIECTQCKGWILSEPITCPSIDSNREELVASSAAPQNSTNSDASGRTKKSPSQFHEALAWAIRLAAAGDIECLFSQKDWKQHLKEKACAYELNTWKNWVIGKVTVVGAVTGLPGGLISLPLEAIDIAILLGASGQGCYGIGHIIGSAVDYEKDLPLILAIWSGCAQAAAIGGGSKLALKVGGKTSVALGTVAASKFGAKMLTKIMPKVAAKLTAKMGSKLAFGWLPLVGSPVSAGINWWVASELMEAAEKYYRANYVILGDDFSELVDDCADIGVDIASSFADQT